MELLQILGLAYLTLMLYLTFLYYKKNNYTLRNFLFWVTVWLMGALMLLMPETTSLVTQKLKVARVIDFYLILGIMFFSIICFLSYNQVKRNEQKIEELVRKIALEKKK